MDGAARSVDLNHATAEMLVHVHDPTERRQAVTEAAPRHRAAAAYLSTNRLYPEALRRSSAPRPRCRGDRTRSCTLCTLHSRADCDAWPATDRRPPCQSLPVRACRLPACPASAFACLLCGQAGPHNPRTTSRDAPRPRAACGRGNFQRIWSAYGQRLWTDPARSQASEAAPHIQDRETDESADEMGPAGSRGSAVRGPSQWRRPAVPA